MVTFLDQKQRRYGVRMTYDIKQSVNGERSLSGKISEPQSVLRKIDRGWRLLIGDEYYVVTYIKPHDKGRQLEVEFDAVHQFFWDFSKSSIHTSLNDGSHTFEEYLHFIFDGSGYSFRNEVKRYAFEKQSFGYKNRLSLFNDVVKQAGVEFVVHGRVVRILDRSGSDLTTVVRKNFNMNELKIEKNVKEFATFQAGFGAWNDKDDHSKGRLSVSYRSPLADEYGVVETDPFVDERYTDRESLLNKLKSNVDSSYEISVQIDMEDLTKAGYPYTQPRCGDYIMAINEVLGFRRRVRIISFTSSYDIRGRLISHKITCGSISAVEKSVTQVSALSAKIGQAQIETAEAYKAALEALVATNGKNKNYWGDTFPTDDPPGTLIKGDQLYYQNGEKTELYVWNGLEWQKAKLGIDEEELEKEIAEIEKQFAEQEKLHNDKVAEVLDKAESSKNFADEAKRLAEKAGADVTQAQERSELAIRDALAEARRLDQEERKTTEAAILAARNKANDEARRLVGLSERALQESINDLSTEVTKTNDAIKLKADKTTVDNLTGKVSQAEATLRVQAGEIAKSVKTADFDKEKEKLRNAETNIRQLDEKITTEISRTEAKIPRQVGSRNFIKNSELTEFSYSGRGVYDLRFWIVDDFWKNHRRLLPNMVRVSFDIRFEPALPQGVRTNVHFSAAPWYNPGGVVFGGGTTNLQHFDLLFDLSNASESYQTDNVFIRFTDTIPENTKVIVERFTLHLSEMVEVWEPAFEDTESELESVKTTITQTAEGTNQLSERFTQSEGKMSRQETKINQLIGEVSSKVSQTDYNNLKRSVDSHATEINQTKSAINLKADRSQIDELSSRFRAELQVANDAISAKVSKSEFNNEKNRVTNAETQINAIAGQISTKLSRTEVNQLIDTKGFITNSTFTNAIEQTERGLTTRIAQVENQIPDGYSGANLILEGARQTAGEYWKNTALSKHGYYYNGEKYHFQLNTDKPDEITAASNRFKVKRNTKYALSFWTYSSWNMKSFDVFFLGRKKGESNAFTSIKQPIKEKAPSPKQAEYVTVIFDSGENDEGYIRFDNNGSKDSKTAILGFGEVMLVEGNTPARYSPSPDELATTTALHEVRDTVDSHTRTLVSQGRSISQVVQTAEGIVSRVANTESNLNRLDGRANFVEGALNATKNEVSQLAGSWAVRNLTDSGTVLNQLNLNKDGSVKIDGSLVQITGRTYIQDGVISSAKIGNLDAGKITTGTLNAARVTIINMDASNIVTGQMSANRIRGGTISALNDRSQINLQNGRFYVMDNNAGFFRVDPNAATTGMKFINYDAQIGGQTRRVSKLVIGGDRRQESSDSNFGWDKGGFTGIVISTVKGAVSADDWQVDDVQMVGDRTVFTHSYYEDKSASNVPQQGWQMFNFSPQSPRAGKVVLKPYNIPRNNSVIETGKLYLFPSNHTKEVDVEAVLRELKNGFVHIKNAGFSDAAATAIVNSINRITSLGL